MTGVKKKRGIALILALITGFFSWIYTYKLDYWKFWVSTLILTSYFLFVMPIFLLDSLMQFYINFVIASFTFWLWAIIDFLIKDEKAFEKYDSYTSSKNKSKIVGIFLAFLLNFLAWLYTYKLDYWKFWAALISLYLSIFQIFPPQTFYILYVLVIIDMLWKKEDKFVNYSKYEFETKPF